MNREHAAIKRLRDRVVAEPFRPVHELSDDALLYAYIKRIVVNNIELTEKLENAEIELSHLR